MGIVEQGGRVLYRAVGAAAAIGIMELLAAQTDQPLWRVPFVTSIVLVMMIPDSEAARPYSVLAGHMLSCAAGYLALYVVGPGPTASAIAVGLAGFSMLTARAPHPPAGIDAFLVAGNALPFAWTGVPVLAGCLLLVAFSQVWRLGERWAFGDRRRGG